MENIIFDSTQPGAQENKEPVITHYLFVESGEDEGFFKALFKSLELQADKIKIIPCGGLGNIPHKLYEIITDIEVKLLDADSLPPQSYVFALVRDADEHSVEKAFSTIIKPIKKNIKKARSENKETIISLPSEHAVFAQEELKARLGIFIMPGKLTGRMIEDLCLKSVKDANEKVFNCIDGFMNCVGFDPHHKHIAKRQVQAFLSTREDDVYSIGVAAQKGYWDFDHQCFDELKAFLKAFDAQS